MNNETLASYGYIVVVDKLELTFKDPTNYFSISAKGAVKVIINDDTTNIVMLKNNERLEIGDLLVSKIVFIRDTENCVFAKVKYYTSVNSLPA